MPIVTKIVPQRRREQRYNIYVDGAYRLSLSQEQLADAGLRVGDELDQAALDRLVASSDFGKALDRTYRYLSYRARSRHEIITYLRQRHYDDDLVGRVVEELERHRLVDDGRFAAQWVEDRQLLNPRSRRHLQAELRHKHIDPVHIETALASIDSQAEIYAATQLIDTKHLRQRYTDHRKLVRYLMSIGFSAETITVALMGGQDAVDQPESHQPQQGNN